MVEYSYETCHLEEVLDQVRDSLTEGKSGSITKVSSVAMVLHSSERELFLCQVIHFIM